MKVRDLKKLLENVDDEMPVVLTTNNPDSKETYLPITWSGVISVEGTNDGELRPFFNEESMLEDSTEILIFLISC